MPVVRISKPRRHFPGPHHLVHCFCLGSRLRVGHQRHWTNLSRPMTGLATLLKDGKNVLVKRRSLYKQQDRQECHARNVSRNIPLLAEEGRMRRAKRRRRRGGQTGRGVSPNRPPRPSATPPLRGGEYTLCIQEEG